MGQTVDIGTRIELVPMDPHFHEITIGLYRQEYDGAPVYCVHTYSGRAGADQRIAFVSNAMVVLGGMAQTPDGLLRFPCGEAHELACRRVFLEACKLASGGELKVRPLTIVDRKSGLNITVSRAGSGEYRVEAEGEGKDGARRIAAIAGGSGQARRNAVTKPGYGRIFVRTRPRRCCGTASGSGPERPGGGSRTGDVGRPRRPGCAQPAAVVPARKRSITAR